MATNLIAHLLDRESVDAHSREPAEHLTRGFSLPGDSVDSAAGIGDHTTGTQLCVSAKANRKLQPRPTPKFGGAFLSYLGKLDSTSVIGDNSAFKVF